MNEFQRKCQHEVEAVMKRHQISADFHSLESLAGASAPTSAAGSSGHFRAQVVSNGRFIDIYLYQQEAGLKAAGHWYVFERQRYADEKQLIAAFVEELDSQLGPAP